ncbi:MAG: tetratricopeptide repeat protein [Candidatus Krumholzibacteriia bacterium]
MHRHTGHAGLWPPSGAVNLYLGNSPDLDATLAIRPGLPWEALIAAPARQTGVNDPWRNAAWYAARTREFVRRQPGRALANLGRKTLHLLASRELPRNLDIMALRPWSPVLRVTLWRVGRWGFPTGVLLPLALVGFWLARRRLPSVVPVTALLYAAALVLVFTSARYRAPLWPLAAIGAVAGVQMAWRAPRRRTLVAAAVAAALLTIVGTVPGPFAQERTDLRAEMWHGVGFNQLQRGELAAAEASFRQALALREQYPEAWNRLGVALARQERYEESIGCFARAAALAPDYREAVANLKLARRRAAAADAAGQGR